MLLAPLVFLRVSTSCCCPQAGLELNNDMCKACVCPYAGIPATQVHVNNRPRPSGIAWFWLEQCGARVWNIVAGLYRNKREPALNLLPK